MNESVWQRLDQTARNLTPVALTLLLLVLSLVPWRLPFLPPLGLNLTLISIFYWIIHRPSAMPIPAVFAIGVVADLIGGGPLVSPFVLVTAAAVLHSVRRWLVGASTIIVWGSFFVMVIDAVLLLWLLIWYVSREMPELAPGISGALLGAAAYPLIASLLSRVEQKVLRQQ
jgi:rod shape-determining protein MreD